MKRRFSRKNHAVLSLTHLSTINIITNKTWGNLLLADDQGNMHKKYESI